MADDLGQILELVVGPLAAVASLLGAAWFMERWMSRPVPPRSRPEPRPDHGGLPEPRPAAAASSPDRAPARRRPAPRHARERVPAGRRTWR
ncbi:MAG TPA: hypothetical protein VI248_04815 [Kineosporiaceae bacterium]